MGSTKEQAEEEKNKKLRAKSHKNDSLKHWEQNLVVLRNGNKLGPTHDTE